MTRKDFEALAVVVNDLWAGADGPDERDMVVHIAHDLADVCAENERFDRARFLKACGVAI